MSFLIKVALLVTVVVFFIPADPEELAASGSAPRSVGVFDAYSLAVAAYGDASGFCDRNPAACVTGAAVGDVFRAKARTALRTVQSWIAPKSSGPAEVAATPTAPESREAVAHPIVPERRDAVAHPIASERRDAVANPIVPERRETGERTGSIAGLPAPVPPKKPVPPARAVGIRQDT